MEEWESKEKQANPRWLTLVILRHSFISLYRQQYCTFLKKLCPRRGNHVYFLYYHFRYNRGSSVSIPKYLVNLKLQLKEPWPDPM